MKKPLGLLFLLVLLSACSKSDDGNNTVEIDESVIFLQKTITTHPDGTSVTADYSYDGNLISGIIYSDDRNTEYIYEDGFLKEKNEYDNGTLIKAESYGYFETFRPTEMLTVNYIDETVIYTTYSYYTEWKMVINKYNVDENGDLEFLTRFKTQLQGNSISEAREYNIGNTLLNTFDYTYDIKNNPFVNTEFYDAQIIHDIMGSDHNLLNYHKSGPGSGDSYQIRYTYNEANFPATSTKTHHDGSITTTAYFYE